MSLMFKQASASQRKTLKKLGTSPLMPCEGGVRMLCPLEWPHFAREFPCYSAGKYLWDGAVRVLALMPTRCVLPTGVVVPPSYRRLS